MHLIEKWKVGLDNGHFAGAVLMDLSKAFDKVNRNALWTVLCQAGMPEAGLHTSLMTSSRRRHGARRPFSA